MGWADKSKNKSFVKIRRARLLAIFLTIIIISCSAWILIRFTSTYWFTYRERANLLIKDDNDVWIIALDNKNNLAYDVKIQNDLVVNAPGGYGQYPFSGVVKLADVEKNPLVMVKSAAWMIGAPIDDYLLSSSDFKSNQKIGIISFLDKKKSISNLRYLDRIWWWWKLKQKKSGDFVVLKTYFPKDKEDVASRKIFSPDKFSQNYEGYFFDSKIRNEDTKVVIKYKKHYKAAENLSRVWRGVGVRVVSIEKDENSKKICALTSELDSIIKIKYTSEFITKFDHCDKLSEKIQGSDLIVYLGEKLENDWR